MRWGEGHIVRGYENGKKGNPERRRLRDQG